MDGLLSLLLAHGNYALLSLGPFISQKIAFSTYSMVFCKLTNLHIILYLQKTLKFSYFSNEDPRVN
jgi:hypothetical protein